MGKGTVWAMALAAAVAAGCAAPKGAGGGGSTAGGDAWIQAADTANYVQVVPGVSKAVLWGDPASGTYGTFTRFDAGLRNPLHTHSHEVRIVVLRGAYVYEVGGVERRVPAGSFIRVPAGVPHFSGGDLREGALFLETSPGSFDLVVVK